MGAHPCAPYIPPYLTLETQVHQDVEKTLPMPIATEETSVRGTRACSARVHRCLRHAAYFAAASEALIFATISVHRAITHQDPTLPGKILIVANAAVLISWRLVVKSGDWDRIAAMFCHFSRPVDTSSIASEQRPHTILLSGFFHMSVIHFLNNMLLLRLFSPYVVENLGYRQFAYFYTGALYASSFFDVIVSRLPTTFVPQEPRDLRTGNALWNTMHSNLGHFLGSGLLRRLLRALFPPVSIGASGGICAIIMFHALELQKKRRNSLGTLLVLLLVSLDIVPLLCPCKDDPVSHGSHIGGYAFGCLVWVLFPQSMKSSVLDTTANEISGLELGFAVGLSILFCGGGNESKQEDRCNWFCQECLLLSS